MTTINLYQDDQELKKKLASSNSFFSGGVFFALGILVLTMLVLFGLKLYIYQTNKTNENLRDEVKQKSNSLINLKELGEIVDLQARIEHVKNNLKIQDGKVQSVQMVAVLDSFEADINKSILVTDFEYSEDGKVKITFRSNNYSDIAQQLATLKSSKNFKDANLVKIARDENGIECSTEMYLK